MNCFVGLAALTAHGLSHQTVRKPCPTDLPLRGKVITGSRSLEATQDDERREGVIMGFICGWRGQPHVWWSPCGFSPPRGRTGWRQR